MPFPKELSGSSGSKGDLGRNGRKRPRVGTSATRPTSPIDISSDDNGVSVAEYQKKLTDNRKTRIDGDSQSSISSTTSHVREVFEAACEANVALRQEHRRRLLRLEGELRTAEAKIAALQLEVATAVSSAKESQEERDTVCDTLAVLQQELEVAQAMHDQVTEEVRIATNKGAQIEEELRNARTVCRPPSRRVTRSSEAHFVRKLKISKCSSRMSRIAA